MIRDLGSYNTSGTRTHVRFQFSTHAAAGGNVAPSSAFEAADIRIYRANDSAAYSATQRSSANGITMTSPFDSLTGVHDVDIDLADNTDAGFYAAGYRYSVILAPDETVDSLTITGVVLGEFEIGPPPANVTQFGGTAGTFSSGVPAVNATQLSGDSTAADNAELFFDGTGYGHVLLRTTIAGVTDNADFTLTAGSTDNSAYNGCVVVVEDQSTAVQKAVGVVLSYTGATKRMLLLNNPGIFTFAAGDIITVLADRSLKPVTDNRVLDVTAGQYVAGADFISNTVQANVVQISGDSVAADNAEAFFDGTGYAGTGNVIPTVGVVSGAVGSVTGNVGGNVSGSIGSLAAQAKQDVNAEVDTAMADVGLTTTITARIDAAISTRLASASYTAPDNSSITAIKAKTDNLPSSPAAVGSAMTLTSGERDSIADAYLDRSNAIETAITPRLAIRYIAAACAGTMSGGQTATEVFAGIGVATTRIIATVDSSGNRTGIALG